MAGSGFYFGIQIFIPLELLSRATFEGLAFQMLQLMGALLPVLADGGFVTTALCFGVGGHLILGTCHLLLAQARPGSGSPERVSGASSWKRVEAGH